MKLYSFTNMYLSDIQKGIQTAHLINAFWKKYSDSDSNEACQFWNWTFFDEIIVVLNGGSQEELEANLDLFSNSFYPFAAFREYMKSLNGALTVVGISLPENFSTREDRDAHIERYANGNGNLSNAKLAELLNKSRLA